MRLPNAAEKARVGVGFAAISLFKDPTQPISGQNLTLKLL